MTEERPLPRALVLETDPLVSERLRAMLRAERWSVCAVDEWLLFRSLAAQGGFGTFVVGSAFGERAAELEWLRKLEPLWVLLASPSSAAIGRLRMALPGAQLIDAALRDPDAVRRALGAGSAGGTVPQSADPAAPGNLDWLRSAFGGFGLSGRQLEVLGRALRGETSREIAARLFISEPTVRNHLHAIYERVGVKGHRELLGRFVRALLEPGEGAAPRAAPPAPRARVTVSSGTR